MLSRASILWEMFTPMNRGIEIRPFNAERVNPNSYDVSLAGDFYLVQPAHDIVYFVGPVTVPDGERVYLPPGCTVLARTVEWVGTSSRIVAQLHSKSSTRRCGISVCDDAGLGDGGYSNYWTAELVTNTATPGSLVVGAPFAQLSFDYLTDGGEAYDGQYTSDDWPACMIPRKLRGNALPAPDSLIAFMRTGNGWSTAQIACAAMAMRAWSNNPGGGA